MTTFRSEDMLGGLVALALVPLIAWTIRRGLRRGALPIGRGHVRRDERAGAFNALLAFYAVALVLIMALAVWQVTGDVIAALGTPDGHGHRYGPELVDEWWQVARPDPAEVPTAAPEDRLDEIKTASRR